jgi:hypothetical protein
VFQKAVGTVESQSVDESVGWKVIVTAELAPYIGTRAAFSLRKSLLAQIFHRNRKCFRSRKDARL